MSIYLIQDNGKLVEMSEAAYDSEDLLQTLLAQYPRLLAGDQIDSAVPREWLLITREASLPDDHDAAGRWSVDHLFVDQDAIPTLVEVKRSSDTRIRREVVGQMLDYAANAVLYWSMETIRTGFEETCRSKGEDPAAVLAEFLGDERTPAQFWVEVEKNLTAGKIRLLFVADMIPRELQRIVEFLNKQMAPAEVLAVEIKQFVGSDHRTLVPRVIGQTVEAERAKAAGPRATRQWDEGTFFEEFALRRTADEVEVARKLVAWVTAHGRVWWGRGATMASFAACVEANGETQTLFGVYSKGAVEVHFQFLKNRAAFATDEKRQELARRISDATGAHFGAEQIARRPSIPIQTLTTPEALAGFLRAFEWVIEEIRAASA